METLYKLLPRVYILVFLNIIFIGKIEIKIKRDKANTI